MRTKMAILSSASVDAIRGCVLGAAIGDALGYPVEFLSSLLAIRERYGAKGVTGYVELVEQAGQRFAPYSDDTQLAMAVLRALLWGVDNRATLDATMRRMSDGFVEWAVRPEGGHRAPGAACLAGCRALESDVPWDQAGAADAGGCGSVMRVYPFALLFADDAERAEEWAVQHSKLTHRAPIALAACAAMARGLCSVLHRQGPTTVLEVMCQAASRYDAETAIRIRSAAVSASKGESPEIVLARFPGWAAHDAIAAAAYVFARNAQSPRAALLEAVNSPGDSDSIGTLVGALVGATCGLTRLPSEWVRDIERRDELLSLADQVIAQLTGKPERGK